MGDGGTDGIMVGEIVMFGTLGSNVAIFLVVVGFILVFCCSSLRKDGINRWNLCVFGKSWWYILP